MQQLFWSRCQCLLLQLDESANAGVCEIEHGIQLVAAKGVAFRGPLQLNEMARVVHDHVHVGLGFRVFRIIQVEHSHTPINPYRNRCHVAMNRVRFQCPPGAKLVQGNPKCHVGARDGCRPRAAVRLDDIAVQCDRAFPETVQVHDRAQGTPDESLNLHGSSALASARGFTMGALGGGSWQHAVFGGDPTAPGASQKRRRSVFDRRIAKYPGITELDQDGSFGVLRVASIDSNRTQFLRGAAAGAHDVYLTLVVGRDSILGFGQQPDRIGERNVTVPEFPGTARAVDEGTHMIRSMTAFARHQSRGEWGEAIWELRSVNHRYSDVFVRLPESLRALETAVRERAGERIGRGKIECSLRFQAGEQVCAQLSLNKPLADRILLLVQEMGQLAGHSAQPSALDLLRWPGVVEQAEPDLETVHSHVLEAFDGAVRELIENRSREGARIRELLVQRLSALSAQVAEARRRRPGMLEQMRDKWRTRLAELGVDADPGRIEQEMAIAAQRLDVDEELDRLDGHITELYSVLDRDEPVGRRLDFLMQELNREANTLSSKSGDGDTTRIAVEMKVLIEQMREQIQNVE